MITNHSYEDVYTKAAEVSNSVAKGLSLGEIEKTAQKLGVLLERKQKYNLDSDIGILSVRLQNGLGHVVVLAKGIIIDPQPGTVYLDVDTYKAVEKVKFGVLLRVKDNSE